MADEFVGVKANMIGCKDKIVGMVFRVRRGDESTPWDVGEIKSYDESSERYEFLSFLSHTTFTFELPDVALRMYAPDARLLDSMLKSDDKDVVVNIPRRFGADSRPMSSVDPEEADVQRSSSAAAVLRMSPSPVQVVAVHELLPSVSMPSARRGEDSSELRLSASVESLSTPPSDDAEVQRAKQEELAQKQAQREALLAQLQVCS